MIETLGAALLMVGRTDVLGLVLLAIPLGLLIGVLPGISGLAGLALTIPLVYGMEPFAGLAFLLALHSVVYTGGSVSAILLGIPGAPANAATVADGLALSRRGRAGYAIGAALTASACGGLVGVAVLAALLPFLQQIVEAFASPETFLLALIGVVLISVMGEGTALRGLMAGALGMFLGCFGYQDTTGVPRFWLDSDYLLDGFRLVPLCLGLFAVPEIVSLMATGRPIAERGSPGPISRREVRAGMGAVLRNIWVFLRSSVIGVLVGVIPGLGGETAPFVAYASAKQASARPSEYGHGSIEAIIAAESSNNAKEGGSLIPTLAFGVPGSAAMSLLLGAFLILGLEPGPEFLRNHMDLSLGLALVIALSNLLAAGLMLIVAAHVALVTRLQGHVLAPLLLVAVVVGTYASANTALDVAFAFLFGLLGWFMRAYQYSRPALIIGFVLVTPLETYLRISLEAYGVGFITRPAFQLLLMALLIALGVPALLKLVQRRANGTR